jgi:hypothetical protein
MLILAGYQIATTFKTAIGETKTHSDQYSNRAVSLDELLTIKLVCWQRGLMTVSKIVQ